MLLSSIFYTLFGTLPCIEIEYYILSNYDSTYIFEVVFKNDYYWGGELYLEFN